MLFIKNLTKNAADFGVRVVGVDGDVLLSLVTPDGSTVPLLCSKENAILQSIRRSIDYVGRKTSTLKKSSDGVSVETKLFQDKATEIAFYVKGEKISLEPIEIDEDSQEPGAVMSIDVVKEEEDANNKKKYPRDLVVVICDRDLGEDAATAHFDKRNITGEPIYILIENGYQAVVIVPKWPVWSDLKFPVYMCFTREGKTGDDAIIGAIKLDSRQENGVVKNQVSDVDYSEASTYLKESQKIFEQQQMQASVNKINRKNNPANANRERNTDRPKNADNRQDRQAPAQRNDKGNGKPKGDTKPARKGNPSVKFPVYGGGKKSSSAPKGNNAAKGAFGHKSQNRGR